MPDQGKEEVVASPPAICAQHPGGLFPGAAFFPPQVVTHLSSVKTDLL